MRSRDNRKDNKPLSDSSVLKGLQNNIIMRVVLCVMAVALTVILVFSLTIAWSTNVVQSGGLFFTAEKWDFNGEVTVSGDSVTAAPGDRGGVSLTIANKGEVTAAASVTVSKVQMDDQMKKRMYFYVEDSVVRNGETVSPVYISQSSSYTYTVFPGSTLYMNESSQNAPALKWEWVYDVLGYYVYGTQVSSDGTLFTVNVTDYIRPIVYEYDPVFTTFDGNGKLLTVDGVKTVGALLEEVTKADGYEGNLDASSIPNTGGYYKIDVNEETGTGVWLYLCTLSDINDNNKFDTNIGSTETAVAYTAKITVTGRNIAEDVTVVSNETELLNALSNADGKIVQLADDITISSPIAVDKNKTVMLDLNGNTLTSSTPTAITANTNSNVMILNGEIVGAENPNLKEDVAVITVSGADVTLSDVIVTSKDIGVQIYDNQNTDNTDSRVHLIKSKISAYDVGIIVRGNADASEEKTVLILEDCIVEGETYAGIYGNGGQCGTDIQIRNSEIKGYYTSIFHPQLYDSTMTVTNSTLEGYTGIVIKAGTVSLVDCQINATAETATAPTSMSQSGFADTGDAVYIETNYAENESYENCVIDVTISGSNTKLSLADTTGVALAIRQFNKPAKNTTVKVEGGSFETDVSDYLAYGYTISETANAEGYYTVTKIENAE